MREKHNDSRGRAAMLVQGMDFSKPCLAVFAIAAYSPTEFWIPGLRECNLNKVPVANKITRWIYEGGCPGMRKGRL